MLATLILLAYLMHTVLDLLDRRYREIRARLPSRRTFFEHLRTLVQYLPFNTWDHLFDFMRDGLAPAPPKVKGQGKAGSGQICNCWIVEREGSRVLVRLFNDRRVFHPPHPESTTDKGAVETVSKWLDENGVKL